MPAMRVTMTRRCLGEEALGVESGRRLRLADGGVAAYGVGLILGLAGWLCAGLTVLGAGQPNFLIFLADDLGYSDVGCYGGEIATPNLDALAAAGVRFTDFYNTSRCWPTRGSLLTGYYAQAIRRDALPGLGGGAGGKRPPFAVLLPALLKPLGYRSYHSGKWHIDGPRLAGGFDRSYSVEDHDRHFAPANHFADDVRLPPVRPGSGYYTTTAIAERAIEFLREHEATHRGRPFLQFVAFTAPHFPLHALREDIDRYRDRYLAGWDAVRAERARRVRAMGLVRGALPPLEPEVYPAWNPQPEELVTRVGAGEVARAVPWESLNAEQRRFQATKMAIHAAMVDRMDREIGRVLAQVKSMGVWENTVVMFLSDNGASAEQIIRGDGHDRTADAGSAATFLGLGPGWSSAANAPFRRHKSWTHEGGIATPMVIHWPGGLRRGDGVRRTACHVVDVAPTLLELAGGVWPSTDANGMAVPPSHGRSLAGLLRSDRELAPVPLWWLHDGHRALRVGDWKIVAAKRDGEAGPWELYRLRGDRSETKDLAVQRPEKVRELEALWLQRRDEFGRLASAPR